MRTIYKYPIYKYRHRLPVPAQGIFRHIGLQDGVPTLWIEGDTEAEKNWIEVRAYATGEELSNGKFLGTLQFDDGLVFHFFSVNIATPKGDD